MSESADILMKGQLKKRAAKLDKRPERCDEPEFGSDTTAK
jgi:hypothetical protein